MITKYKIQPGVWPGTTIETVEVERENEDTVWVDVGGGSVLRQAKMTGYHEYHDTWDGARDSLLTHAQRAMDTARRALDRAQDNHHYTRGMSQKVAA